MTNSNPLFFLDHCCSCGLKLNSHMKENKDYFVEKDADGEHPICSECKTYWDEKENVKNNQK